MAEEEQELCPICHSIIGDEAIWTDDPILTLNGYAGTDYKGFTSIFLSHILEIQETRAQEEIGVGIVEDQRTAFTDVSSIQGKKFFLSVYINELRESTEKILIASGITKEVDGQVVADLLVYFNNDAEGIYIGTYKFGQKLEDKIEWSDIERDEDYLPKLPSNITWIENIHLEDLRHSLLVVAWYEDWQDIDPTPYNFSFDDTGDFSGTFTYTTGVSWNRNSDLVNENIQDFKCEELGIDSLARSYFFFSEGLYNPSAPASDALVGLSGTYPGLEDWSGFSAPHHEANLFCDFITHFNVSIQKDSFDFNITGSNVCTSTKADKWYTIRGFTGGYFQMEYPTDKYLNPSVPNVLLSQEKLTIYIDNLSWSEYYEELSWGEEYNAVVSESFIKLNVILKIQYPEDYFYEPYRGQIKNRNLIFIASNKFNDTPSDGIINKPLISSGELVFDIRQAVELLGFPPPEGAPIWFGGNMEVRISSITTTIMSPADVIGGDNPGFNGGDVQGSNSLIGKITKIKFS